MTKQELSAFCYQGEDRPGLEQPFSLDGMSVATDGRILVAVPQLPDVPEWSNEEHPGLDYVPQSVRHFLASNTAMGDAVHTISLTLPPAWFKRTCTNCAGKGIKTQEEDSWECPVCDGEGKEWELPLHVRVGQTWLSHLYLHRLRALPNCRLWPSSNGAPCMFEFTGGRGVVACMSEPRPGDPVH